MKTLKRLNKETGKIEVVQYDGYNADGTVCEMDSWEE
tara:strand:- start:28 stop:138 length:111 start_codon:yes stop_codon:yes gene_type:complete